MQKNDKSPRSGGRQRDWLFYSSLAVLALLAFLLVGSREPVLFDDSGAYMRVGNVEGVMPIYPLFLLLNQSIFGLDGYLNAVIVEQAVLAALCVILFVKVIRDEFDLKYWESYLLFFLALLPFTVDMPQSMVTQQILTEGIAYALFYLFTVILLKAVWTRRYTWLAGTFVTAVILSMVRPQLQILFGICGIVFLYVICIRKKNGRKLCLGVRVLLGIVGCMILSFVGIFITQKISVGYQDLLRNSDDFYMLVMKIQSPENYEWYISNGVTVADTKEKNKKKNEQRALADRSFSTSQYVSLIFSRGMYEADPEDVELFEDEVVRGLYAALYQAADAEKERYVYANAGLWMWQDIVGGIGKVGKTCLWTPSEYYAENYPEIIESDQFSDTRNAHLQYIGITLIRAHFGRFLYHTLMMLPQAFICTVFFQIRPIYLLCHLVTLFLYLSALALMIWGYADRRADHRCAEAMALVLGSNVVMVVIISLVFFGQQRYLIYNFGIFYAAYYLLLRELWNIRIRDRIMTRMSFLKSGRRGCTDLRFLKLNAENSRE